MLPLEEAGGCDGADAGERERGATARVGAPASLVCGHAAVRREAVLSGVSCRVTSRTDASPGSGMQAAIANFTSAVNNFTPVALNSSDSESPYRHKYIIPYFSSSITRSNDLVASIMGSGFMPRADRRDSRWLYSSGGGAAE